MTEFYRPSKLESGNTVTPSIRPIEMVLRRVLRFVTRSDPCRGDVLRCYRNFALSPYRAAARDSSAVRESYALICGYPLEMRARCLKNDASIVRPAPFHDDRPARPSPQGGRSPPRRAIRSEYREGELMP